ncbi:MAG: hypothetical protein ANABAC_0039 [Anaerolineae bacterium]|nr:MAG: hypothetical protein ANABAC_0039 [Anaerolineae bacterium]
MNSVLFQLWWVHLARSEELCQIINDSLERLYPSFVGN